MKLDDLTLLVSICAVIGIGSFLLVRYLGENLDNFKAKEEKELAHWTYLLLACGKLIVAFFFFSKAISFSTYWWLGVASVLLGLCYFWSFIKNVKNKET